MIRRWGTDFTASPWTALGYSLWLTLPTSIVSGALFTLLGANLKELLGGENLATGCLTLANTTGAAVGALASGFLLLPGLGVERSLFALALAYGVVALLITGGRKPMGRWVLLPGAGLLLLASLFPFGLMERVHVARLARRLGQGYQPQAFREGVTETILYLRKDMLGVPVGHRLVTNGFSMSGTGFAARRYMKLFAYWPLVMRPQARRALLISYGIGSTAKALTDSGLQSIDVVDISADILEMGGLAFPPPEAPPLDDPRVRTHVEDGRFFLLTTDRRYDLITAEPPPPRLAGVVSLYSQEYFRLVRDRLAEGGFATHWLPVFELDRTSTLAIVKGFCNVFPDCSLWRGAGLNWMLVGSRGATEPVSANALSLAWTDARTAPALREIGLDSPARLPALFLADAPFLAKLVADTSPLVDDFPRRLSLLGAQADDVRFYLRLIEAGAARERFRASESARSLFPKALAEEALAFFEEQHLYDGEPVAGGPASSRLPAMYEALLRTDSILLPLVLAGSDPREVAVAERAALRGESGSLVSYLLGLASLSRREYARAGALFARVVAEEDDFREATHLHALASCLAGDRDMTLLFTLAPGADDEDRRVRSWLAAICPGRGSPPPPSRPRR